MKINITNKDIIDGSFVVPESVTKIGDYAFIGCKNLESVYCSKKTEIDVNAFLFDKDGEVKFEGVVHYYEEGASSSEVPR